MDQIRTFLETVFGRKPDDLQILLWEKLGKKLSHWFTSIDEAAAFAERHTVNLYAGVNLSPKAFGEYYRCKAADIAAQCAFIADIDVAGPAHKTKALPPTFEDARRVLPVGLKPTLLVHSGNGLQGWWVLKEPIVFANDAERKKSQDIAVEWHRAMERVAASFGWNQDSVYDLSRVLRMPGTINRKEEVEDKQAYIIELNDTYYNLSEIEEYLYDLRPTTEAVKAKKLARAAMPPAVEGFVYNPSAAIDAAIYGALWENSTTFRLVWHKLRPDMQGKSQSEWDLALANTLWDAEVSDQHAADAITHYRRIYSAPQKDNPSYYLRTTLAKARDRSRPSATDNEARRALDALLNGPTVTIALPDIEDIEAVPVKTAAAPEERAEESATEAVAEQIAENDKGTRLAALNLMLKHTIDGKPVPIAKCVWIRGTKDDASWRVELADGQIVMLADSSNYSEYGSLQRAFRNQVNGVLARENKKGDWARQGVAVFQACLVEERVADHHDVRFDIGELLEQYLNAQTPIPHPAIWSDPENLHLPAVYKGQVAIHAEGMCAYMNRTRGEHIEPKMIRSGLSALKATVEKINGPRGKSQSRWILPAEYNADEYIRSANEQRARQRGELLPGMGEGAAWAN